MKNIKDFNNFDKLNESNGVHWDTGYFEAIDNISLGLGAWRITIKKGSIVRITDENFGKEQKMETWDALKGEWINRKPPISGVTHFNLAAYRQDDAQGLVDKFNRNSNKLSEKEANNKISSMVAKTTLTASKGIKMLQGLNPKQKVTITISNN